MLAEPEELFVKHVDVGYHDHVEFRRLRRARFAYQDFSSVVVPVAAFSSAIFIAAGSSLDMGRQHKRHAGDMLPLRVSPPIARMATFELHVIESNRTVRVTPYEPAV